MVITLPWPHPYLSPNARKHWAEKARTFKNYKAQCMWEMVQHKAVLKGKSAFTVTFCPPDRHRRDLDNAISSFKAGGDAIAVMTGVDDSKFQVTYRWGEPCPNGAVLIEIVEERAVA